MEKQRLRNKKILFAVFCISAVGWLVYRISVEGVHITPRYTFEEQYKYK
jgi:hypothetical protein